MLKAAFNVEFSCLESYLDIINTRFSEGVVSMRERLIFNRDDKKKLEGNLAKGFENGIHSIMELFRERNGGFEMF